MPDFKRGAAAIDAATKQREGGGNFRAFAPQLFWSKSGDDRHLLFLNEMADIPTANAITFIPRYGKKANGDEYKLYDQVIARTDPVVGEANDPMADDWQGKVRATSFAVAVELEPEFEEVNGRKRPTGFRIKTNEFERRVRDANGDLTDERETVEAPAIGFVTQSPNNFFNALAAYDATEAPINETPIKVTRVGADKNTQYTFTGYPAQDIDLSGLLDNVDVISYFGADAEDAIEAIAGIEDDFEAATVIGNLLLDKRLDELCDREYYDELYNGIRETLDPWSAKKGGGGKAAPRKAAPRERAARPSQRKARNEAPAEEAPEETPVEPEPPVEETPADEPDPVAEKPRGRRAAAAGGESSAKAQMEKLKARAAKAGKATA